MHCLLFWRFVSLSVCRLRYPFFAASIVYYLISGPMKLGQVYTVVTGNMFANYTMLAAPLFIFMANVLNESEVTDKLFAFCNGMFGKLRGGTAQVNVFISLIFSGMTGSAIADASGIGLMEIEQMKKEGVRPGIQLCPDGGERHDRAYFPAKHPVHHLRYAVRCFGRQAFYGRHDPRRIAGGLADDLRRVHF